MHKLRGVRKVQNKAELQHLQKTAAVIATVVLYGFLPVHSKVLLNVLKLCLEKTNNSPF